MKGKTKIVQTTAVPVTKRASYRSSCYYGSRYGKTPKVTATCRAEPDTAIIYFHGSFELTNMDCMQHSS
jgi:hypothetical protein